MRGLMMLAFLAFFIATVATTPAGTSHVSHAGGFICGLFPSFLFLPHLRRRARRTRRKPPRPRPVQAQPSPRMSSPPPSLLRTPVMPPSLLPDEAPALFTSICTCSFVEINRWRKEGVPTAHASHA